MPLQSFYAERNVYQSGDDFFFFGTGAFNYSHHNDSVKLEALGDVKSWSVEDSLLILL